jgi:hypothetical protein
VKFSTRRSAETGPNVGVQELVKKVFAALSGIHCRRKNVRNPPAMKPATRTPA